MTRFHCGIVRPSTLLILSACVGAQDAPLVKSAATSCGSLTTLTLDDARVDEASVVEPTPQQRAAGRGVVCRVAGTIGNETRFVALLPDIWNRRFVMGGGGGFVGRVHNMAESSVDQGFATVGTDAGHQAPPISGAWALGNPERVIDYAYRAVHRTAEVSKAIIETYYGSAPVRSYFYGCSNGGREALMEAQRYPDDFDGIVAIAPLIDWAATLTSFLRNVQELYPTGNLTTPALPRSTLAHLERRVLSACDARDGVTDSVINDPRTCDFTVASLAACPDDRPGTDCVTSAQRAAIQRIYSPVTIGGKVVYHGQPVGNEGAVDGWFRSIVGPDSLMLAVYRVPAAQFGYATEFFKYFVFNDSLWDYRNYEISRAAVDARELDDVLSPNSSDLSAFARRGGKLLLAHGWSDPVLNALQTIDYLEAVKRKDASADAYVRLFLMPGVLHCEGGTGCDQADWLGSITQWVERGTLPDRIVASRFGPATEGTPQAVVRTRPLCAYPRQAVYSGSGSTDEAQNFVCK